MALEEYQNMDNATQLEKTLIAQLEKRLGKDFMLFYENPNEDMKISAIVRNSENLDLLHAAFVATIRTALIQIGNGENQLRTAGILLIAMFNDFVKHSCETLDEEGINWNVLKNEFYFLVEKHFEMDCGCDKCKQEKTH